jgi:hypothetical protein
MRVVKALEATGNPSGKMDRSKKVPTITAAGQA